MKIIRNTKSKMCTRLVQVCNAIVIKNCIYVSFITFMFTMCILLNMMIKDEQNLETRSMRLPTDLKYILFWRKEPNLVTEYYSKYRYKVLEGQNLFINQKCKYINCYISYNKNLLNGNPKNFDAVVFNVKEIDNVKKKHLKLPRSPDQLYIFNSMDSAECFPVCLPVYDDFFNLTWTYRFDSDIPNPFFDIYDWNKTLVGPKRQMEWISEMKHTNAYNNVTHKKTKAVAWIVNKCRSISKHNHLVMDLVEELRGYNYTVDIFGHCGAKKCPNNDTLNCYTIIERDYYFQLVLEDSIAPGHITERMALAMMYASIPIVQGGKEYARYGISFSLVFHRNIFNNTIVNRIVSNGTKIFLSFMWKSIFNINSNHRESFYSEILLRNIISKRRAILGIPVTNERVLEEVTELCQDRAKWKSMISVFSYSYLPPGSYININNQTIKELGAIIDYLIKNPDIYEYFYDWKKYYSYTLRPKDYVCDLCQYLSQNTNRRKMIKGFRRWWNPFYNVECHQKKMFDMFYDNDQ